MLPIPYHLEVVCRVLDGLERRGECPAPALTLATCHLRLLALLSSIRPPDSTPCGPAPSTAHVAEPWPSRRQPPRNLITDEASHALQ